MCRLGSSAAGSVAEAAASPSPMHLFYFPCGDQMASNEEQLCSVRCSSLAEVGGVDEMFPRRDMVRMSNRLTAKAGVGTPNLMQFWRNVGKAKGNSAEATPNTASGSCKRPWEEHTGTSQPQSATFPNCPQGFLEPGTLPPELQLSLPTSGTALTTPAQG